MLLTKGLDRWRMSISRFAVAHRLISLNDVKSLALMTILFLVQYLFTCLLLPRNACNTGFAWPRSRDTEQSNGCQ